jgi:very-short-patch-repair endonuclease
MGTHDTSTRVALPFRLEWKGHVGARASARHQGDVLEVHGDGFVDRFVDHELRDGLRNQPFEGTLDFIVDFACTKVRLALEVDGPYHEHRSRPDARRDRVLTDLGWSVLRIQDELVFQDLDAAIASIIANAKALAAKR